METPVNTPVRSAGAVPFLVVDLVLMTCACLQLGLLVPVIGEMFADFGADLPLATQVVLNLSIPLTALHHVGLGILICSLCFVAILVYTRICRHGDRKKLFVYLWTTLLIAILACGIMTVTMFLPIFKMGGIVGGPIKESNQASDATSEPAPGAGPSSHQR